MPEVVIGRDVTTGELITLAEIEWRGGVYLLGCCSTGKSTWFLSLLLQDLERSKTERNR